jgi:hypothetical protein
MARNWMESVCVVLNGTKADKKEEGVELASKSDGTTWASVLFDTSLSISM